MSFMPETTAKSSKHEGFPWQYVIGFVLSIVLTAAALWLAVAHKMAVGPLMTIVIVLAVIQIFVQLFLFMHITESDGPAYHSIAIGIALFFVFCIVAGSIWIMTFNAQVA